MLNKAFNSLDCKNTHLALCIVIVNLCINGINFEKKITIIILPFPY